MKRLSRDIIFRSDELNRGLAQKSVRGGMVTMTGQVTQFVLYTTMTVILARLLTPDDYGLIAIVMVVVGFAKMFKDAGLSMATVQKDRISHEQVSTLFWVNIIVSVFLCVCVLASSPLVARFYGRPELTAVTAALSVSFIISGLMVQHQALLRRHMQFGSLAIIQVLSQVVTLGVAVVLALLGWRYWALVGSTITTALVSTLMTFFFCPWIPSRMKRGTGVRDMLKFGGHLTVFNFVNYISTNVGQVILGRTQDAFAVGNYTKAQGLLMMPLLQIRTPINSVMIPALSKCQNNPERYRRYYYSLIFFLAFVTMPLAFLMALFSREIILLLLGPQWVESIYLFRLFSLYAIVYTVATTRGLVLVTLGKTAKYTYWGIALGISRIVFMAIGSHWGAIGIAGGFVMVNYIIFLPSLFYCFKDTPISTGRFLKTCVFPFLSTVSCGLLVLFLRPFMTPIGHYRAFAEIIIYLIAYGFIWLGLARTRVQLEISEIRGILASFWRK